MYDLFFIFLKLCFTKSQYQGLPDWLNTLVGTIMLGTHNIGFPRISIQRFLHRTSGTL